LGLVEDLLLDDRRELILGSNLIRFGAFSAGFGAVGGLHLPVHELHEPACAGLVIDWGASVDRIRDQIRDHAPVPERAVDRRDAQVIQTRSDLTEGDCLSDIPSKYQLDVLDAFFHD
jgi:hypothetical protein